MAKEKQVGDYANTLRKKIASQKDCIVIARNFGPGHESFKFVNGDKKFSVVIREEFS